MPASALDATLLEVVALLHPYTEGGLTLAWAGRSEAPVKTACAIGDTPAHLTPQARYALIARAAATLESKLYPLLETTLPSPKEATGGVALFRTRPQKPQETRSDFPALKPTLALLLRQALCTQALEEQLFRDAKTPLHSYPYLRLRLAEELKAHARHHHPCALVALDLDHFKEHNHRLGEVTADRLLSEVAGFLSCRLRPTDAAARFGGDEFVLLLPQTTREEALAMAESRQRALQETRFYLERAPGGLPVAVQVQTSVGVAVFPQDARTDSALLAQAFARMHEDKARRRAFALP